MLNCYECDLIRIQRLQNKALRLLLRKDRRYSTTLFHRDARLASWKARALTASMRFVFKFKLIDNTNDKFDNSVDQITTRSNIGYKFNIEHPNSSRYLKSTSYILRTEWNNLPTSYRNFDDFELFKLTVKRHYKEKWESEKFRN